MPRIYVGVGSNLGSREHNVERGLQLLRNRGFRFVRRSPCYETDPVDMPGARKFLNLVIAADTDESPLSCLNHLLAVEREVGRKPLTIGPSPKGRAGRGKVFVPRVLDLDLLLYGRKVIRRPGLSVPHPHLHERAFVLVPLSDIAPGLVHPVLHRRISSLRAAIDDRGVRLVRPEGGRGRGRTYAFTSTFTFASSAVRSS